MNGFWLKYRLKWSAELAHEPGEWSWQFIEVCPHTKDKIKEARNQFIAHINDGHSWLEHYRGVESRIATPPVEVVQAEIRRLGDRIRDLRMRREIFKGE